MTDLGWNEYLMGFAEQAARKSKDSTKVGAVLVGPDERTVLLTSFNGPPMGVRDTPERRERPTKYLFASHAEANLIAFAARHGIKTDGCSVHVTHMPCASCARTLIQAGIRRVLYGPGTTSMPREEFEASAAMFAEAGISIFRPPLNVDPEGEKAYLVSSGPEKPWYPDDDPRWQEHTPGDPAPCDGRHRVRLLSRCERNEKRHYPYTGYARIWNWGSFHDDPDVEIVAWRPADDGEG